MFTNEHLFKVYIENTKQHFLNKNKTLKPYFLKKKWVIAIFDLC